MSRHVRVLRRLCLWIGLFAASSGLQASTDAECTPTAARSKLGSASAAIAAWESANRLKLFPPAQDQLLTDLCKVFQTAAADPGRTPASMSAAAEAAVKDHLDREVDPKQTPRSVAASFRSALGLSGYSRPASRRMVVVEIAGPQGGQVDIAWSSKDGKQASRTSVGTPGRFLSYEGSLALTVRKGLSSCQPAVQDVDGGNTIRVVCR